MRPTADTFTLELSEVKPSDAGAYRCTVYEWTTSTNGNAKKTSSQSQDCIVEVRPVGKSTVCVCERERERERVCVCVTLVVKHNRKVKTKHLFASLISMNI